VVLENTGTVLEQTSVVLDLLPDLQIQKLNFFFSEERKSSIHEPRLNGKTKKGVKKVTISTDAKQDPDHYPANRRPGIVVNYLVAILTKLLLFLSLKKRQNMLEC
jgi:hypothetical protein